MRDPIVIGNKIYKYKKEALVYYKNTLNSYKFGEFLSDEHFDDLLDLIDCDYSFDDEDIEEEYDTQESLIKDEFANNQNEPESKIKDIRIAKVQFNAKCFEILHNDSSICYISYIQIINRPKYDPNVVFNTACRNSIQNDIRNVKLRYFKDNSTKGQVKCQETEQLCKWEDLVVDHRQPNTFSIIVERFKEVKQIDIEKIEYFVDDKNQLLFGDQELLTAFVEYHKMKANLRIVKKENNLSRTGMARLKQTPNDLKII